MAEQFFPFGFSLILTISFGLFLLAYKGLRERKVLRLREMIHEERIAAMQHNQPLPPVPLELRHDSAELDSNGRTITQGRVLWLRLASLAVGLLLLGSGFGILVAFTAVSEEDLNNIWAIGFIPLMTGGGLLLFYAFSASYAKDGATND